VEPETAKAPTKAEDAEGRVCRRGAVGACFHLGRYGVVASVCKSKAKAMNKPIVETTVERLGNYWVAEMWIHWPDGPPQWKIVSKRTESELRECLERIRWFLETTVQLPTPPAPQIDWFGGA